VVFDWLIIEMNNEVHTERHEVGIIGYKLIVIETFYIGILPSHNGIGLVYLPIMVTMDILDLIQMHH
jgi:hypothetical protein